MTQPSEPPADDRRLSVPSGAAPPQTAVEALRDRVLHLARPKSANSKIKPVFNPPDCGGVALCGDRAIAYLPNPRVVRDAFVLADSAVYETWQGTVQTPLQIPDLGDSLFADDDPLSIVLGDLTAGRPPLAFAPTGYIVPGDFTALKALVKALAGIDRDDVVAVVALAVTFLRKDAIDQVGALLKQVPHPVALVLGGQYNPTDHYADIAGNLRRLYRVAPNVGLWRADVVSALDCMAYGGLFAGIGSSGALRHLVPFDETAQHSRKQGGKFRPSIFLSELLNYTRADTLADRYGDADPLKCWCSVCGGKALNRFDSGAMEVLEEAAAHNTAAWITLWEDLRTVPLQQRPGWWALKIRSAIDEHRSENDRIDQPGAFKPSPTLKNLAKLGERDGTPL